MTSLLELTAALPSALPTFPSCKRLRATQVANSLWLACLDLARELGHNGSKQYLGSRFQASAKYGLKVPLAEKVPTLDWDGKTWAQLPGNDHPLWMVEYEHREQFSMWISNRSRKTGTDRQQLLRKLNVEVEADSIKVPIETSLLSFLAAACPYKIEYQHRIGKYRLDAFIPRLNMAIQIDEHGHAAYDPEEEKEYNTVMRDLNVVCIRFNPHLKYAHAPEVELVRQVWDRTVAADFSLFRKVHGFQ